jgi:hypothetical protein
MDTFGRARLMKIYEDERISFLYPDDFKMSRAKTKYGSYMLTKNKNTTYVSIDLIAEDVISSVRNFFRSQPPDDVGDYAKVEYIDSIQIGNMQGIGHHAIAYDRSHNIWGEIYRYLFLIHTGGLYIEISDRNTFTIDLYKELLESIRLKE